MIKLIYGAKGSGKTGKIVDLANDTVDKTDGEVVFLTDTEKYMHRLNYNIRLINVTEYSVSKVLELAGFILGILAGNHDISHIFIDGIHRMTNTGVSELGGLFKELENYSNKHNINIICTVSADTLPDYMANFENEKA